MKNEGLAAHMDDLDAALLRSIELALQNPRGDSPAAAELTVLVERTRLYESRYATHPLTGDLCSCAIPCADNSCRCWCHQKKDDAS